MDSYAEYKSSLCSLKNLLGLGCIHILNKEELMPYISKIISKLNERLILEDKETTDENIKLFIKYYEDELDKLIGSDEETLGLNKPDPVEKTSADEVIEDYGFDPNDLDFNLNRFLISWANIYSTIYIEEMYNYSYLFTDSSIDCHECCGSVTKDENGNLIYNSKSNNISSKYYCGCGGN